MQKEIEYHDFVHVMNIHFINSLQNNGTENFLFFEHSHKEIFNSIALVDFATAGRHHGLSFYLP